MPASEHPIEILWAGTEVSILVAAVAIGISATDTGATMFDGVKRAGLNMIDGLLLRPRQG